MHDPHSAVERAIQDVDRLRKFLKRNRTPRVRSSEEKDVVQANCLAWFNNHRPAICQSVAEDLLSTADDSYKALLTFRDRATSRAKYDGALKALRQHLSDVRGYAVSPSASAQPTSDDPPSFEPLVADPAMQAILGRRWGECARCIAGDAPLAATVMMGGLLEALLLARIHRERSKAQVLQASSAPKDQRSGKPLPLQQWTLRHYIDVAHELGWISPSARDVGAVIRDYRNYIHPHKELTHGIRLDRSDARLFWEISKSISRQLLAPTGA